MQPSLCCYVEQGIKAMKKAFVLLAGVALIGSIASEEVWAKSFPSSANNAARRGDVRSIALTPQQQEWVNKIETWMNEVTTLKARFQQVASNGAHATGNAWIERPGKMRFEYAKPSPLLLVANDGKLVFRDKQLDQTTTIPLEKTPLGLLLRDNLHLSGDVAITGFQRNNGFVMVRIVKSASAGDGNLTLVFWEQPFALRGWRVVDAQGRRTQVDLFDLEKGEDSPSSLFNLDVAHTPAEE